MRPRTFEIRGWPAVLMLGVFAVMAVGIIALLVMVGAAVAVAGLAISAVAALYYAVRRKLTQSTKRADWSVENPASEQTSLVVREIEVEVLPQKER
jgi:membrane associated rhomboid family serine protease